MFMCTFVDNTFSFASCGCFICRISFDLAGICLCFLLSSVVTKGLSTCVIFDFRRISLNTMTLTIESPQVYTSLGVAISVTGIAQVFSTFLYLISRMKNFPKRPFSVGPFWAALLHQADPIIVCTL